MHQPLTPAAARALERASAIAAGRQSSIVEPPHLLKSIVEEESRASEILAQFGVAAPEIDTQFLLGELSGDPPEEPLPLSEVVELVLQEATHLAGTQGRHAEVGTEHLIGGLLAIESEVAAWLQAQGVRREDLGQAIDESSGFHTEPLRTDVEITFSQPDVSERYAVLRIMDAAANRTREGLRVVEDFLRFQANDPHLSEQLKQWRHDLQAVMRAAPAHELLAARDTTADVGTSITTPAEQRRGNLREVLAANLKRVQEGCRTLEEYAKTSDAQLAAELEQLRYRFYTLEKAIAGTLHNRGRLEGRLLYLLVTEKLCHHGVGPAVRDALAGGVGIVQLREKEMDDRRLVEWGRRMREWTRAAGALLIMNDRPDIAVLIDADGVHVGQEELTVSDVRRIIGTERLVGVSTHDIRQARQAVLDGADYIGVGPVFPSQTKPFDDYAGLDFVREVAAEITLPWYPIGGINAENIAQLIEAGATRAAVTGAICSVEDARTAAQEMQRQLAEAAEANS